MSAVDERSPLVAKSTDLGQRGRVVLLVVAVVLVSGGSLLTVKSQWAADASSALSTRRTAPPSPHPESSADVWSAFKALYGKEYESADHEATSRANFEARLAELADLNAANGETVFGVTRHADRPLGAQAYHRGRRPRSVERDAARSHVGRVPPPEMTTEGPPPMVVDWRDDVRGVVTPVKNQGQCGSCWAFAAAEQIESQLVLAGAPAVELSPQQLASCVADPIVEECCDGCGGGDPSAAYEYLVVSAGLAPEAFWPYSQKLTPDGECEAPECTQRCDRDPAALAGDYEFVGPYATINGYSIATPECEAGHCDHQNLTDLAHLVAKAPLAVCLNAQHWDDYTGGVLTDAACGGHAADDVDHCVQLVGYNRHDNYWILRNSWSTEWGMDGFIHLQFDANTCGLANEATLVHITGQWQAPEDEV